MSTIGCGASSALSSDTSNRATAFPAHGHWTPVGQRESSLRFDGAMHVDDRGFAGTPEDAHDVELEVGEIRRGHWRSVYYMCNISGGAWTVNSAGRLCQANQCSFPNSIAPQIEAHQPSQPGQFGVLRDRMPRPLTRCIGCAHRRAPPGTSSGSRTGARRLSSRAPSPP